VSAKHKFKTRKEEHLVPQINTARPGSAALDRLVANVLDLRRHRGQEGLRDIVLSSDGDDEVELPLVQLWAPRLGGAKDRSPQLLVLR